MRRAISYPCSGPSSSTLNTANSAVPRLIPGAIILMLPIYRHLTYKHRNVNCTDGQCETSVGAQHAAPLLCPDVRFQGLTFIEIERTANHGEYFLARLIHSGRSA